MAFYADWSLLSHYFQFDCFMWCPMGPLHTMLAHTMLAHTDRFRYTPFMAHKHPYTSNTRYKLILFSSNGCILNHPVEVNCVGHRENQILAYHFSIIPIQVPLFLSSENQLYISQMF